MREKIARQITEYYDYGSYVSKKIVTWEILWMIKKSIEEGKQGCYIKFHSWFNGKRVQLVVCKCVSCFGDKLSAQKLVKAVNDYLGLQTVTNTVQEILKKESTSKKNSNKQLSFGF